MLQVTILLTVLQLQGSLGADTISSPSGNLEVHALPVGQGDCTIIQCPMGELVINDCGSLRGSGGMDDINVRKYLGNRIANIEAIFISHGDQDHYNYLPTITDHRNENIRSVIIGGKADDYFATRGAPIQNWLIEFNQKSKLKLINNGEPCIGTSDCAVPGGTDFCNNRNIHFNILAANIGKKNKNEKSIVLKVVSGDFSVLLPGDMEGPASLKIADALGAQLQSSVYKMAHHGASTQANKQAWLDHIRPTQAFASSPYNGRYGHPRCETIHRILNLNTITPAKAHKFYCEDNEGKSVDFDAFAVDIYTTSPTINTHCFFKFTSTGINENCIEASMESHDVREEDELLFLGRQFE